MFEPTGGSCVRRFILGLMPMTCWPMTQVGLEAQTECSSSDAREVVLFSFVHALIVIAILEQCLASHGRDRFRFQRNTELPTTILPKTLTNLNSVKCLQI